MTLRRSLQATDITSIRRILEEVEVFTAEEVACGVELAQQTAAGDDGYHWVLAEEDNELLGIICYGSVPLTVGTWDLYWILRSPRGKKQGVAARLLAACEEDIKARNARLLVLNTSGTPPYQPARDFYLRHGFQLTARIPEYYRPGDDLLIFTKKLG